MATTYGAAALSTRQRSQGSSSRSSATWNAAVCRIIRAPAGPTAAEVVGHPIVALRPEQQRRAVDAG